jgi:GR25 family glycosyltransferase involved in LPS biosynthesis
MINIGIMWFPRKRETFKDMQKSIGVPFTVYPDSKEFKHETENPVKYLGEHAGCFKHYYRVLEDLCKSDADYVAVLSDDILFKDDWVNVAISGLKKDVAFVAC